MKTAHAEATPRTPPPRGPSVWARLPGMLYAAAWRHRGPLAPAPVTLALWAAGVGAPAATAVVACLAGGLLYRLRVPSGRWRPVLSERERVIWAAWLVAAGAWALGVYAWSTSATVPPGPSLAVLAAVTVVQDGAWLKGRMALARRERGHAREWRDTVSLPRVPAALVGSRMVPGSMREPGPGATTMTIELADDVHAQTACAEDVRRWLERQQRLPLGTLTMRPVRDDSGLIEVTRSPGRHLEAGPVSWPGPVIEPDGWIPLAETVDGRTGKWRAFDGDGVMHGHIVGVSGGGKSTTLNAITLPLMLTGRWVVIYADGGKGGSLKEYLHPAMSYMARRPEEWGQAIRATVSILDAREDRRPGGWSVFAEGDPTVLLVIDEATVVNSYLSPAEQAMVVRIAATGRKHGVHVIQITQNPGAANLIGGTAYRTNATQVVAHRAQSPTDARIAVGSGSEQIDLLRLAPESGWCAVISHGRVTFPARVRYATDDAIREALSGFTPRMLAGPDWDAARPYLDPEYVDPNAEPEETPTEAHDSRARLLLLLRAHTEGVELAGIAPEQGAHECTADGCPGWVLRRRMTSKHLTALHAEGLVIKDGRAWRPAGEE